MGKNVKISLTLLCFLATTSCQKIIDRYFRDYHPDPSPAKCRIVRIEQLDAALDSYRTGIFHYDVNGRLDSVVFDQQGVIHYWKYDAQNRLIEYRETFNEDLNNYKALHRYAWQGDRISQDTVWLVQGGGPETRLYDLEYDISGRVVKETGIRIDDAAYGTPVDTITYNYDRNGNLVYHSGSDEHIHYLRTNKVLQFTERNYSRNNPAYYVLGYNEYRFPIAFRFSPHGIFLGWGHPDKIVYDCVDR